MRGAFVEKAFLALEKVCEIQQMDRDSIVIIIILIAYLIQE